MIYSPIICRENIVVVQYSPFIYAENIVMVQSSPFICRENILMVKYSPNPLAELNQCIFNSANRLIV